MNKPKPYNPNEDGHIVLDGAKTCTVCNTEYPATDQYFYKHIVRNKNGSKYVLDAQCKECSKKYSKNYIKNHKEQAAKYEKEIYRPRYREQINAKQRRWREENKDYYYKYLKEYIQQHPEKTKQYNENRKLHKAHILKTNF